jgi:hypothetical protein
MANLTPELLDKGKLKVIDAAMRKDLRAVTKLLGGSAGFFVAAANVPLADKSKTSIFVVTKLQKDAKAWQLKLKGLNPQVITSGTCTPAAKGANVHVALDKVSGDRKATLRTAKLAFKTDLKVTVADPLADEHEGSEDDSDDSDDTRQQLKAISPKVGAIVDGAPVDNAEALKVLQEFERLGLGPDGLEAALKETFG